MTSHQLILLLVLKPSLEMMFSTTKMVLCPSKSKPNLGSCFKIRAENKKRTYARPISRIEQVSDESCQRVITWLKHTQDTAILKKGLTDDFAAKKIKKKISLKRQISDWKFGPVTWLMSESFVHVVLNWKSMNFICKLHCSCLNLENSKSQNCSNPANPEVWDKASC